MSAAANQLHENETKGSMIDLYLEALDEIHGLKESSGDSAALAETNAELPGKLLRMKEDARRFQKSARQRKHALRSMRKQLENGRWRPTDKVLPEDGQDCLVALTQGNVLIASYSAERRQFLIAGRPTNCFPDVWQPLPESPKLEQPSS